jgi:hypothetical protein
MPVRPAVCRPKSSFETHELYPSQTKILEGWTKDEIRISKEALFKGVSTRFGRRTVEKSVDDPDFIFCSSFQNRRLGSINFDPESIQSTGIEMRPVIRTYAHPKRKCWKAEHTVPMRFRSSFRLL